MSQPRSSAPEAQTQEPTFVEAVDISRGSGPVNLADRPQDYEAPAHPAMKVMPSSASPLLGFWSHGDTFAAFDQDDHRNQKLSTIALGLLVWLSFLAFLGQQLFTPWHAWSVWSGDSGYFSATSGTAWYGDMDDAMEVVFKNNMACDTDYCRVAFKMRMHTRFSGGFSLAVGVMSLYSMISNTSYMARAASGVHLFAAVTHICFAFAWWSHTFWPDYYFVPKLFRTGMATFFAYLLALLHLAFCGLNAYMFYLGRKRALELQGNDNTPPAPKSSAGSGAGAPAAGVVVDEPMESADEGEASQSRARSAPPQADRGSQATRQTSGSARSPGAAV